MRNLINFFQMIFFKQRFYKNRFGSECFASYYSISNNTGNNSIMTISQDHVNGFGLKFEYICNKMHSIRCNVRNLKNFSNDFSKRFL